MWLQGPFSAGLLAASLWGSTKECKKQGEVRTGLFNAPRHHRHPLRPPLGRYSCLSGCLELMTLPVHGCSENMRERPGTTTNRAGNMNGLKNTSAID